MQRVPRLLVSVAMLLWPAVAQAANLTAAEAAQHIGQEATVCDVIASGHYAARSRGQPTFLDFGKALPAEVFTAVIWGEDRAAFGTPETTLVGKHACVSGKIRIYRGRPEIVLHSAGQLSPQ
jgi:hypothetical protein